MLNPDQTKEFDALLPGQSTLNGANRRTALKVALGVGYAATAMPIMAQTAIQTSSEGLATGEAIYDVSGFSVPFFYAMPAGKKNLPVVLVVQEIFGVHEYIADTCRRFAKAGYLAIAPELYARQGDPTKYGETAKLIAEVVSKVPDEQVMGDLDGAVKWAGENGGNLKKVGITGFCWEQEYKSWGGLVRAFRGHRFGPDPQTSTGLGGQRQGTRFRFVWWPGWRYSFNHSQSNERRAGGSRLQGERRCQSLKFCGLQRRTPCVSRRLPTKLPQRSSRRRVRQSPGLV